MRVALSINSVGSVVSGVTYICTKDTLSLRTRGGYTCATYRSGLN